MPLKLSFWDHAKERSERTTTINIGKLITVEYDIPWEAVALAPAKGTIKPGTDTVSALRAARVKQVGKAVKNSEGRWTITIQFIQPEAYS
jgi:hypothetical protein